MRLLHTESSSGWGGQEIRILKEAEGMRQRGHEVILAVAKGGGLVAKARSQGFLVYELPFKRKRALCTLLKLMSIVRKHSIDIVNTHSSLDAWLGGIAARLTRRKIVRTRHLSTAIRKGLNSRLLYKGLADFVVTTSSAVIPVICKQARLPPRLCRSIATGADISQLSVCSEEIKKIRQELRLHPEDCLVGTACFVRSWKGIKDFMKAAEILKKEKNLKWIIVGGGHVNDYKALAAEMNLGGVLTFTGHLEFPYAAIAAMDVFALLSTAHEGVSQASLQAAYLKRPLITTTTGGLPEVCLDGVTGLHVPPFAPEQVAEAVLKLKNDPLLRQQMGQAAHERVLEKFTLQHTLDQMSEVYCHLK
jgi:glycosyltransferase involved in cell wall biosynthesis